MAGARRFSLGAALADELATAAPGSVTLVIDVEHPAISRSNIAVREFDLNPLYQARCFEAWSVELHSLLMSMVQSAAPRMPVRGVVLGAARYHVGQYESTTITERAAVLGTNILGKWEILHAVMRLNADRGFENVSVLDVFDIGSLHGLYRTPQRALYNPTKTASLALCQILIEGQEVRRAIHVAPGPIDTPMLHWNHWVLKEKGDPGFPDLVRHRLPSLYEPIFRNGDAEALTTALLELGINNAGMQTVFERYKHRRKMVTESEKGLTSPESLAAYLASLMLEQDSTESGVIEVTSPHGGLKAVRRPF